MDEQKQTQDYTQTSQEREDAQTRIYLRSNGPPRDVFEPSEEAKLLAHGKSDGEAYLILEASKNGKQTRWTMNEVVGLKGVNRTLHARLEQGDAHFAALDAVATIVTTFRDKWLDRRKVIRNTIFALATLFLMPMMSVLFAEVLKPLFLRLFGIHTP